MIEENNWYAKISRKGIPWVWIIPHTSCSYWRERLDTRLSNGRGREAHDQEHHGSSPLIWGKCGSHSVVSARKCQVTDIHDDSHTGLRIAFPDNQARPSPLLCSWLVNLRPRSSLQPLGLWSLERSWTSSYDEDQDTTTTNFVSLTSRIHQIHSDAEV